MEINLILLVLLIFASGLFSGSESALFSLDLSQREAMKKNTDVRIRRRVKKILGWLKTPEKTLASILLGNLAVNIVLAEVGHSAIASYLEIEKDTLYIVSVISITVLVLIFGEILPKVFAIGRASEFSLRLSPFLTAWFAFSRFLAWPVVRIARVIIRRLPSDNEAFSEQELKDAIALADDHGIIDKKEIRLLRRSISYLHGVSYDAMIPRSNLFMLPHSTSPSQAKKAFNEGEYQFALIYHKKDGKITGFMQARHLLLALFNKQKSINNVIQQVLHLPETMPLNEVVETFIHSKTEVAVIVDEAGEVMGAITLKKILASLLGESDRKARSLKIQRLSGAGMQTYKLLGNLSLNEFNEYFDSNLVAENSETLSGFLLEHLDGFPHSETALQYENFEFFGMQVENYMIQQVQLRITL